MFYKKIKMNANKNFINPYSDIPALYILHFLSEKWAKMLNFDIENILEIDEYDFEKKKNILKTIKNSFISEENKWIIRAKEEYKYFFKTHIPEDIIYIFQKKNISKENLQNFLKYITKSPFFLDEKYANSDLEKYIKQAKKEHKNLEDWYINYDKNLDEKYYLNFALDNIIFNIREEIYSKK